jgi:hypothetical protein
MVGSGKAIGVILLVIGFAVCAGVSIFIGSGITSGQVSVPGAILGIFLFGLLPLLLFGGAGAFLFIKGRAESSEMEVIRKKERLLGMIQAQGQVSLGTVMIQMKMSREEVQNAIYELVNLGLFAGYIDWGEQKFISKDASEVASNKCPNCGGTREVAGKGIVKCPYCGVELYIPQNASAAKGA